MPGGSYRKNNREISCYPKSTASRAQKKLELQLALRESI